MFVSGRYEEMRALREMQFRFADKASPSSYVGLLSNALQLYADEDLLLASHHVPLVYDPVAIGAYFPRDWVGFG